MTDIAVIILIGQEKIHLQRCVEKLAALSPRQIFLVESQPDDGGVARFVKSTNCLVPSA